MGASKAYEEFPQHKIEIDEEPVGVRITCEGVVIAETSRGLNLREGKYPDVIYIPRKDVFMNQLRRAEHSTHCPFKGDASYFDFDATDGALKTSKQIAWSYETPFDQMLAIRSHLAFYADRVEIQVESRAAANKAVD